MQRDSEDEAWRAIVENYGERPDLGGEPGVQPGRASAARPTDPADHPDEPDRTVVRPPRESDEDRYVPPPPPPLPSPARDRLLAWLGVFGAPAVLLTCLVAGISLPSVLSYALVASFVGGFLYLVWRMPRGPRDPWDDGARI